MLVHTYLYRLKCILRDKQTMFWTLAFPIILATLFNLALSNITSSEKFSDIKVGIISDNKYYPGIDFVDAMKAISTSNNSTVSAKLFKISDVSMEEVDKLLEDGKLEGYIYLEDTMKLVVKQSGLNQTIIKEVLDTIKQTTSTVVTIISENPAVNPGEVVGNLASSTDYLKEVSLSKAEPNTVVNYFYSLIAMTCLYGSFMGLKEVTALQANLSPQGARISIVPTHKLKLVMASMLAAVTVQIAEIAVLLGYLNFILKISFGSQIGYIALTCLIGTITGVTFGSCISAVVKKSEGLKVGILIGTSMLMTFLSGMMYHDLKYIISTKAPVLAYLNPANLITDCFYSLYYYDTHTKFFTDIALLSGFAVIFSSITYLVLRRQRYASL